MERRPEPELMDSEAQTRAYAEAGFAESNSLFVESFLDAFPDLPATGHLVDLGCGPADICIRLVERLPGWRVTAVDAGENMLQRAREAVQGAQLEDAIELRLAHLPDPGLEESTFDAVVSNSLLHHLPDPMTLWDGIRQLGRPGAAVLVMDLARPASEDAATGLVERHVPDAPEILREDFYNSLLAAYTVAEVRGQLDRAGLAQFHLGRPSDRHWLASGRLEG